MRAPECFRKILQDDRKLRLEPLSSSTMSSFRQACALRALFYDACRKLSFRRLSRSWRTQGRLPSNPEFSSLRPACRQVFLQPFVHRLFQRWRFQLAYRTKSRRHDLWDMPKEVLSSIRIDCTCWIWVPKDQAIHRYDEWTASHNAAFQLPNANVQTQTSLPNSTRNSSWRTLQKSNLQCWFLQACLRESSQVWQFRLRICPSRTARPLERDHRDCESGDSSRNLDHPYQARHTHRGKMLRESPTKESTDTCPTDIQSDFPFRAHREWYSRIPDDWFRQENPPLRVLLLKHESFFLPYARHESWKLLLQVRQDRRQRYMRSFFLRLRVFWHP